MLLERTHTDSGVNEQSFSVVEQIIAVTAASASKTNEFHIL
jgi:hypothetical protein